MSSTDATTLLPSLDLSQTNCLNESPSHPLSSILGAKSLNTNSQQYLESDADEQLLLSVVFTSPQRIRSLRILTASSSSEQAPKFISLAVNQPSIGFDDFAQYSVQDIDLKEDEVTGNGKEIPLRYVRFQKVNSLHILISSNQAEADETRVDSLDVFGVPVETTKDLSGLKNQEHEH